MGVSISGKGQQVADILRPLLETGIHPARIRAVNNGLPSHEKSTESRTDP